MKLKPGKYFLKRYYKDSNLYYTGIYDITKVEKDGVIISTGGFVKFENIISIDKIN